MTEMTMSITVYGMLTDEGRAILARMAAEHWPKELKRIQSVSLFKDVEVKYDLTDFYSEWSPIFHWRSDDPIAWWNNSTGERVEGKEYPHLADHPKS